MIKPEDLAKAGTESAHQQAVMCWSALNENNFPELRWLHANPNGGFRDKRTAMTLKAEGVKAGIADLFLPSPKCGYYGLYIEMKLPKEKQRKEQIEFEAFVKGEGYAYSVCYSWIDAAQLLLMYLTNVLK
jgi:hypothetical protein